MLAQGVLQRRQAEAFARIAGQFQGAQAQRLQQLQDVEIGRRIDRDRVAGAAGRPQRQRQRLLAAGGDHDLLGRRVHPAVQQAPGDLRPQRQTARRHAVARQHIALPPGGGHIGAVQLLGRQQRHIRQRRAEGHQRGVFGVAQNAQHQVAQADRSRLRGGLRPGRLARQRLRVGADIVPRLRAHLHPPLILQQPIRLHDRREADLPLPAELPHRGQAIPHAKRAAVDQARPDGRRHAHTASTPGGMVGTEDGFDPASLYCTLSRRFCPETVRQLLPEQIAVQQTVSVSNRLATASVPAGPCCAIL